MLWMTGRVLFYWGKILKLYLLTNEVGSGRVVLRYVALLLLAVLCFAGNNVSWF